jgi:hypothetical protein
MCMVSPEFSSAMVVSRVRFPAPRGTTVTLAPPSSDRTCPSPHVGFFGQHTRSRFGRDTGQSLSAVLGLGSPHLYYF